MNASVIQGEIFNDGTPVAARGSGLSALRATKIKTPYVAGAALPEYRAWREGRSIDYLAVGEHLVRVEVEAIRLDIALHGMWDEVVDWERLRHTVAHFGRGDLD